MPGPDTGYFFAPFVMNTVESITRVSSKMSSQLLDDGELDDKIEQLETEIRRLKDDHSSFERETVLLV